MAFLPPPSRLCGNLPGYPLLTLGSTEQSSTSYWARASSACVGERARDGLYIDFGFPTSSPSIYTQQLERTSRFLPSFLSQRFLFLPAGVSFSPDAVGKFPNPAGEDQLPVLEFVNFGACGKQRALNGRGKRKVSGLDMKDFCEMKGDQFDLPRCPSDL